MFLPVTELEAKPEQKMRGDNSQFLAQKLPEKAGQESTLQADPDTSGYRCV